MQEMEVKIKDLDTVMEIWTGTVSFKINGKSYEVTSDKIPIDTSLNTFIRNHANLNGTKFMCLEGGCGACIVTVKGIHPSTKEVKSWAVNSCLFPVFSCHDMEITTVEGIGNRKKGYHPIQKRLTHFNGTQCGYCSPGMVMNMYSLLEANDGKVSMAEVENSFGGNICRCTGYRPILDAFKSMAYDADPKLLETCKDIEDLTKICPKNGAPCEGSCHKKRTTEALKLTFSNGKQWIKAYDEREIFEVLDKHGKKPYMLVAGNTAHGVYRRDENIATFIDISGVKSLHGHSLKKDLTVGANISLNELIEVFQATSKKPGFEYLQHLAKHIDLIANVPVRNAGTVAGNLSIKHMKKEFPSDLFLIFESVNAKLTIGDFKHSTTASPLEYLKLDMHKKIIMSVTFTPFDPKKFIYRSFKITPRAQNAHAYVNAGFLVELNNEKVVSARICYGGIDPGFTHARKTEEFLKDKSLFTTETIQAVTKILESEINPDWVLPDASPEYRRKMAIALFYKFVISTCPSAEINPKYVSGGSMLERILSSGIQTFDTFKDKWPVSQFVPKYEGLIQCSGEIEYSNDLPPQPGELWAAFVPATEVHANVSNIDPSDALKIAGVHHFYSAADIPGVNDFNAVWPNAPEEIFVSSNHTVLFHGQPVGLILADTMALANRAAQLVRITYKRQKKPVLPTLHDVYTQKATERYTDWDMFGLKATEKGKDTTKKLSGKFEMGSQYHYTMEPQTTVCVPYEDVIRVYAATQWVDSCQAAIAKVLKIPVNTIDMVFKRCGGAYGAKITRSSQIACACALACYLSGRPVRFVMTLESNMSVIGKRPAVISIYDVETDDNGKIQHLQNHYIEESGCSSNEFPGFSVTPFFRNCYVYNTFNVKATSAITDTTSHTWCRAPGTTEGIAMIENIMEHIACVTGKDPVNVRLANMTNEHKLQSMIKDYLKQTDYYKRKQDIDTFNSQNRWVKRGISMIPMEYEQEHFGAIPVFVAIYHEDGTVAVTHGGVEIGQGINTKVAQVASYVLKIPLEHIKIKQCDTLVGANSGVTGGSMTSESVCHAVKKCCEELLERIQPIRDEMKDSTWKEITNACYAKFVDLTAKYLYKQPELPQYLTYGVSIAEIEIDVLSGMLQLKRVDILEDTGESLSPSVDIGQIEGSFIMGVGYWLTEAFVFDKDSGEMLTNRTWTYKPPGAKDIPVDFRVTFLQNSNNEVGVLGSKATGEPPLCMSVVVLFALRHALEAARKDAGIKEPWFELNGPATSEVIFLKAENSINNFVL